MRKWKKEGKLLGEIIKLSGRGKLIVQRILKRLPLKNGRKQVIQPAIKKKLFAKLASLQKTAKTKKEVTVAMVSKAAGVDACDRVVLDASHEDIYFRGVPVHPILTTKDIKHRAAWKINAAAAVQRLG